MERAGYEGDRDAGTAGPGGSARCETTRHPQVDERYVARDKANADTFAGVGVIPAALGRRSG